MPLSRRIPSHELPRLPSKARRASGECETTARARPDRTGHETSAMARVGACGGHPHSCRFEGRRRYWSRARRVPSAKVFVGNVSREPDAGHQSRHRLHTRRIAFVVAQSENSPNAIPMKRYGRIVQRPVASTPEGVPQGQAQGRDVPHVPSYVLIAPHTRGRGFGDGQGTPGPLRAISVTIRYCVKLVTK